MIKKTHEYSILSHRGLSLILLLLCLLLSAQWLQAQSCTASITGELVICPGGSRVLTASPGSTYAWSTGVFTPSITVTTAGTYTVTVTNATGCAATATATTSILSAGMLSAPVAQGLNGYPVCFGSTLQMSSTVPGGTWKAFTFMPVISIHPTTGLVTSLTANTFTDTSSVAYEVSAPGCIVGALARIEVRGLNPGTINGNASICSSPYYGNNTTQLSVTSPSLGFGSITGTWSSSNTNVATVNSTGLVSSVPPSTNSGTSIISRSVTWEGCTTTATKLITVNANPSTLVTSTLQNTCVNQVVNISVPDAGPGATYSWSGDIVNINSYATTSVSSIPGYKQYNVTVTSAVGCSQTGYGLHFLNELPVATITANPTLVCVGLTLDLSVPAAASTTYAWSGPGLNSTTGSNVTAIPPVAGMQTYTVTAMTNAYFGNCSNTGEVNVMVSDPLACPSIFSPSNGQNAVGLNIGMLDWNDVPGASGYLVSFGTNAPDYNNILNGTNTASSQIVIGALSTNLTYGYKVIPSGNCISSGCTTVTFSTCVPSFTCPVNSNVPLNGNCALLIPDLVTGLAASPGCSSFVFTQSPTAGSIVSLSHNGTVSVVITPSNPVVAPCTVTLTGKDITAPNITCPANTTVNANASCQGQVGSYAPTTLSDNCNPNPTAVQSPASSALLSDHNATQTVTLTANDGNGNTATCSFTVTLKDIAPPTIVCKNYSASLNASGAASVIMANVFQSGSDNCGTVNPALVVPSTFTCTNIGTNTVVLTANDGNGNTATCSATVTVVDAIAPTVICQHITTNLNAAGTASITPASILLSGTDNCGMVNPVSVIPNTFTCSNLGSNPVILTVNDGHGNTATCLAKAIVVDAIAPTMLCKNVTVALNANGQTSITPALVNNGSSDNCTIVSLSLSRTNFNCANLGQNFVSLTGADQSGNSSTCTATVTVQDLLAPVANCKNTTLNLGPNGSVVVLATAVNNNSTDNCSMSFVVTPATLTCANIGSNTVVLRVTDAVNNQSTCTAIVTIKDATAPIARCKNATIFLNESGMATLGIAQVNNGSSDNCGLSSISLSQTQFNCSESAGSTWPVFLTLKDAANNTSTCIAYVTVKDNIAPTAICENTTVLLGANGKVVVFGEDLAGGSFDNCMVISYSPIAKVYTTANIGINNLTVTVKDWHSNAATCVSVVTVLPYGNSFGSMIDQRQPEASQGNKQEDIFVDLYPNPTFDRVNLVFQLPEDQEYNLKIWDLMGRLRLEQSAKGVAGENQVVIDLQNLPAGMYIVSFECAGQQVQKRLVKDRN